MIKRSTRPPTGKGAPSNIRWMQISLGLIIIGLAVYGYITRSTTDSLTTIRLVTGLIWGVLIIHYFASKLVRDKRERAKTQSVNPDSSSTLPKDTNLVAAAFSRRPIATTLVLLLLFLLPIIARVLFILAHGKQASVADWHAILIGEVFAVLVLFVIWRWPNWFR